MPAWDYTCLDCKSETSVFMDDRLTPGSRQFLCPECHGDNLLVDAYDAFEAFSSKALRVKLFHVEQRLDILEEIILEKTPTKEH